MYPFLRLAKTIATARKLPELGLSDTHVSHHICWPVDLDIFMELNNGRVLTLYDLGRFALSLRTGLAPVLHENRWAFAMAGASVRYRRRITMFDRFEMRTRCLGRDEKFFYLEQSMWKAGEAASSLLSRAAVTSKSGLIRPDEVASAMNRREWRPDLPTWVENWIDADQNRPWPPEM